MRFSCQLFSASALLVMIYSLIPNAPLLADVTLTSTATSIVTRTSSVFSTSTLTLTRPYTVTTYFSTSTRIDPWTSTTTHVSTIYSETAAPTTITTTSRTTVTVTTTSTTTVRVMTSVTAPYLTVKTDKPTYRPGEVVRVSGEPITPSVTWSYTYTDSRGAGLEVEIRIFDPTGRLVHTGKSSRNAAQYKHYAYDFAIQSNAAPGTYRIDASYVHAAFSITGSGTFKVHTGAKWTFMVYMDGDNNLEPHWAQDLNRMEKVGSTADVSIVVLFDRYSTNEASLYYVTKESPPTDTIVSLQIGNWGQVNMGDPETLRRFITWTAKNYEASHYVLVLQNHGGGFTGLCWDDHAGGDCLTMEELKKALSDAGVYSDVIVFYACLMQMVEVAYQIRSFGHYIVASEEIAYAGDINYDLVFGDIVSNPDMSARQLAMDIVTRWYKRPSGTISAIDLWVMDDLAISLNNFSQALFSALPNHRKQIQSKRTNTDHYYYSFFVDLYHFAQLIQQDETLSRTTLGAASKSLMASIKRAVIFNWHGEAHLNSHGVSIYFPETDGTYIKSYDDLVISRLIQWDEFIKGYKLS